MAPLETEHVVAIGATVVLAGLAIWIARKLSGRWISAASRGLALAIILAYAADHAAAVVRDDWSPERYLPFHLTDAVTIVCAIALWAPRPLLVELAYFWGLTASLQAVLTPDLGEGFPDLYFWTYFLTHSGAVVAACLLVFGRQLRPRPGAVRRAFAATAAVAAMAAIANLATGGNYMFLREKPASGSLLDLIGPWPVYIPVAAILALAMFAALDAPFRSGRSRGA
ncbi:MAG: TIGR02206 family membrane protein [Actinomycetota bacterium]|nr:TIGR02206 family membrane protein [Actinomycetota bacterium]